MENVNNGSACEGVVPQDQTHFSHKTLEEIRQQLHDFAEERAWGQYHTPRNIVMALVGEVGELAEIFQWRGEVKKGLPEFSEADRVHVGEELSDVLLYLLRLSDVCGIDLAAAVTDKMKKNGAKYPSVACKGSSAKYTAYEGAAQGGPCPEDKQGGPSADDPPEC